MSHPISTENKPNHNGSEIARSFSPGAQIKYKDLFNNTPEVYILVLPDGLIKETNKTARFYSGNSPNELLNIIELFPDESIPKVRYILNQLHKNRLIKNEEIVFKTKFGYNIYSLVSANPISDKHGQVIASH